MVLHWLPGRARPHTPRAALWQPIAFACFPHTWRLARAIDMQQRSAACIHELTCAGRLKGLYRHVLASHRRDEAAGGAAPARSAARGARAMGGNMCTGRAGPPGTRPSTSCCSTVAIQRPGCRLSRTRWVRLHCPGAHIGSRSVPRRLCSAVSRAAVSTKRAMVCLGASQRERSCGTLSVWTVLSA